MYNSLTLWILENRLVMKVLLITWLFVLCMIVEPVRSLMSCREDSSGLLCSRELTGICP